MRWLGLCGHAGAGKDWLCSQLSKNGLAVHRLQISAPIKRMLQELNPYVDGVTRLGDLPGGFETNKWVYPEVRRLMQRMGTQAGRGVLGENVWIDMAMRSGTAEALNVITDVRFQNEIDAIKAMGGIVIKVDRPTSPLHLDGSQSHHVSETGIDSLRNVDLVFLNGEDTDGKNVLDLVGFVKDRLWRKQTLGF